jgi:hypothetical protein
VVQQKLALEAAERGVDINCLVSVKREASDVILVRVSDRAGTYASYIQ